MKKLEITTHIPLEKIIGDNIKIHAKKSKYRAEIFFFFMLMLSLKDLKTEEIKKNRKF